MLKQKIKLVTGLLVGASVFATANIAGAETLRLLTWGGYAPGDENG